MSKNICVIGTGYVGLITSIGLADFGNKVIGVDIDEKKIKKLNNGEAVIYEPGIEEYLKRNIESKRLKFTTDMAYAIKISEVIFIAVGTPSDENGNADLSYLFNALNNIFNYIDEYKILVIKSTVPVGTNRTIYEKYCKEKEVNVDVVSNPEFLREGKAIYDFFHPDRVVIGYENETAKVILEEIYKPLNRINIPFVFCNWESAEIIKYASNGFLALKVAYINQIASLAEESGGDIKIIAKALGMDGRIGSKFLHAGPGYGGSCFPKDTKALSMIGKKYNIPITLIDCVIKANEEQKMRVYNRIKMRLGNVTNKIIGILGLAFKAETDDIRESPSLLIVNQLLKDGAKIQAHDPKAIENFKSIFPSIKYMNNEYDVAKDADALIILTEWNEYRALNLEEIKKLMKNPYIFDTRGVIEEKELKNFGFIFDLIGKKSY